MEPRPHERGNLFKIGETNWNFRPASMEPRPHERGNPSLEVTLADPILASMEPRPHERGNYGSLRTTARESQSFNGATSSRTWKPGEMGEYLPAFLKLQWSHVLTNVETCSTSP